MFYYVSDFELKKIQRVRFWFKNFTTPRILDWKKYNALDFELKFFRPLRFWTIVCIRKITFWFILLRDNDIFCICSCFFKKHDFVLKISLRVRLWHEKTTTHQTWTWKNTTRQILKKNISHVVRFWTKNLTTC